MCYVLCTRSDLCYCSWIVTIKDKKIVFDIQKSVISFLFYRSLWRTFSDIIDKWTGKRIQFIFFPFSLLVIVFPNKNTCYMSNHTCVLYYVWCSGLALENKKTFLHQYLIAFFGKQNEQKDGKTFSHFISLFYNFQTNLGYLYCERTMVIKYGKQNFSTLVFIENVFCLY